MPLTPKQRRYLRSLAHHRKPVVIIGNAGLTPAVINEIDQCLARHELIKIKINNELNDKHKKISADICAKTASERVQDIGRVLIVYRVKKEPEIIFPDKD